MAMNHARNYLEHLLNSIEKKRLLSIKEFFKTDLNRNTNLDEVTAWYVELSAWARKNPPRSYVRCMKIKEDQFENIKEVAYEYYDSENDQIDDVSFVISIDRDF